LLTRAQSVGESGVSLAPADGVAACGLPIGAFLVGTVVGGIAGAVVGTALSPHTRGFVVGLYQLLSRRLTSAERDQLRFELLLQ
jgi:hypothetical protein